MSNEIDAKRSPMEQFQDNLKQQLRDDIARMLPDEAVKEMIAKVVHDEFFAKRFVEKPDPDYSYRTIKVEQGTKFQDMVFEAAKPILERLTRVKDGTATIDEFFEYYVFDSDRTGLADSVDSSKFYCMRDEPEDVD